MRHGCDAIGVHLAALVDRNVFSRHETVIREVKSDLVWRVGIVKCPSAATVNQLSVFVCLARPQSRDPARLAVLSPQRRVDPVVRIERRNDDISKSGVTFWDAPVRVQARSGSAETAPEGMYSGSAWNGRFCM
jgi:hypothetical protein